MHRLVRISPFDSNARRHTSFASVDVYPVIDDRIKIDIKETDVRIDTMRSQRRRRPARQQDRIRGAPHAYPDQHRGRCASRTARSTATARRPGTCCARGSTRSELKKREEKAAADQAAKTDIGWGHQIRSYVLQPYQMVKDLRTGVDLADAADVLDGDLDQFMAAALAQKAFGGGPEAGRGRGVDANVGEWNRDSQFERLSGRDLIHSRAPAIRRHSISKSGYWLRRKLPPGTSIRRCVIAAFRRE